MSEKFKEVSNAEQISISGGEYKSHNEDCWSAILNGIYKWFKD